MRLCVGDGGEQVWTQANPAVGAVQQRHNHCSVWIEHVSAHGHRHAHDQRLGQRQLGHRKELFERNHGRDESSKVLWRAVACLGCWCNHRTSARRPSQPACTQVCRRPPPSLSLLLLLFLLPFPSTSLSTLLHRYPSLFPADGVFASYPYLLPCMIAGSIAAVGFLFGFKFLGVECQ
jgi:hypothetical protein